MDANDLKLLGKRMPADDLISRQAAIDAIDKCAVWVMYTQGDSQKDESEFVENIIKQTKRAIQSMLREDLPSAQTEIIRCKDCKHWRQQTNYAGAQLSFGFCESDDMWRSLYGETYEVSHIDTDDDFYCGYAERRTE